MRYPILLACAIATLAASVVPQCHAQGNLTISSAALNSANWRVRERAFNGLFRKLSHELYPGVDHLELPQATQDALIALLLREAHQDETKRLPAVPDGSEEMSDYFSDIIEVVSVIGTEKAADALLDPKVITTGKMATDGAARAGHVLVAPVLQRFDAIKPTSQNSTESLYALSLLAVMNGLLANQKPPLDAADKAAIEARIIAASLSTDVSFRVVATKGLALLNDDAARARLSAMAANDPTSANTASRGIAYIVRENAARALAGTHP